jgi:hypothetical protein
MSEPELTEAEQAAQKAMLDHLTHGIPDWNEAARAVVATVRPLLYEEVAQRLLQHAQDAEDHDATESAVYIFMVAAQVVRASANSLEGEQDHA